MQNSLHILNEISQHLTSFIQLRLVKASLINIFMDPVMMCTIFTMNSQPFLSHLSTSSEWTCVFMSLSSLSRCCASLSVLSSALFSARKRSNKPVCATCPAPKQQTNKVTDWLVDHLAAKEADILLRSCWRAKQQKGKRLVFTKRTKRRLQMKDVGSIDVLKASPCQLY